MTGAGWNAAGVRAKAMLTRRIGLAGARELAASTSLADAVARLRSTPYGRALPPEPGRTDVEWAVAATVLWHLRVLAGWQPRQGVAALRALAGWFEVTAVVGHARALHGREQAPAFRLGALATAWSRVATTRSEDEMRSALARSAWRDPGTGDPGLIATTLQLAWAERVAAAVPPARAWALTGAAILLARSRFLDRREPGEGGMRRAEALLGRRAVSAGSWQAYVAALPEDAAAALRGLSEPDELWRAEDRWWLDVEERALTLVSARRFGLGPLAGVGALLAVDGHRVQAAVQIAARGARGREALDALG